MNSTHPQQTETWLQIYDLYISVIEEKSTVQSLSVELNPPKEMECSDEHWLKPILKRRLHDSITLPRERLTFSSLTTFQQTVLDRLDRVPAGETTHYGELASAIDRPGAAQAVGQALKQNPYPLLLPCHRVVRSDGSLGGYGGTLNSPVKRRLLELESK